MERLLVGAMSFAGWAGMLLLLAWALRWHWRERAERLAEKSQVEAQVQAQVSAPANTNLIVFVARREAALREREALARARLQQVAECVQAGRPVESLLAEGNGGSEGGVQSC